MNHLLVLGILLTAVLLMAAFGVFRRRVREGFQASQWLPKTPTSLSNTSMNGYTYENVRITNAIFVDKTTATTVQDNLIHSTQLESGANGKNFVVGIVGSRTNTGNKINSIKMVLVTMDTDTSPSKVLLAKLSDAGIKTYESGSEVETITDAILRDAWNAKTESKPTIASDAASGYGLMNLVVRIVSTTNTSDLAPSAQQTGVANTIAASQSIMKCPPHYTFFNSANGDSLCCRGNVNPYKHTCENTTLNGDICSLSGNARDPRNPTEKLIQCRDILVAEATQAATSCPASLPHLASAVKNGADDYKCCANPIALGDGTNYSCSTEDLKDTSRYCIVDGRGVPTTNAHDGKMERLCSEGSMLDTAACPRDEMGRDVFQKVNYIMGDREAKRYDIADLKGLTIPTCFRLNEVCIPESAIDYAKKRGAYKEYDPKTWEFSCAVWSRKNRGEIVADSVKGYLYNPIGGTS